MILTGAVLAMTLAKGLQRNVQFGDTPASWRRLRASQTIVLRRSVAHCDLAQCRAIVLSVDPFSGGSGALITRIGGVRCEFNIAVTDSAPTHYCVSVSGCSLDGSACVEPH